MLKKLIVIIYVILLSSCATSKPEPIIVKPQHIELPPDPIPATNQITDNSLPAEVMKSWISTAVDYRGWNIAVRKLIESAQ